MKKLIYILLLFVSLGAKGQIHALATIMETAEGTSTTILCDTIITTDTLSLYNGLTAWWDFDGNANDSHNSLNGTVTGATQITGYDGYAYQFDNSDVITVSDNDLLSFNEFTFAGWVRMNSGASGYNTVFWKQYEYWFFNYGGQLNIRVYNNGTTTYMWKKTNSSSVVPTDGSTWAFIAATYNGNGSSTGLKLYINGVENTDVAATGTATMSNTSNDLYFGRDLQTYTTIQGDLDKIRIYHRELSASGIDSLYNLALDRDYNNLISSDTVINCQEETLPPKSGEILPTYFASADYYVDDTGTGDTLTYSELQTLVSTGGLVAGDTVALKAGLAFYGALDINYSGTTLAPIVIGAYGQGERPKIYGSQKISGTWTNYSGNIWQIACTVNGVSQVFEDGVKLNSARYPNTGWHYVTSEGGTTSFTSTDLNGAWNYAGTWIAFRSREWWLGQEQVSSSSGQTLTMSSTISYDYNVDEGFIMFGSLNFLDQAGEWYLDEANDILYVFAPDGTSPSDNIISVTTEQSIVDITNQSYVNLEYLDLQESNAYGINGDNISHITIDSVNISYAEEIGLNITNSNSSYVTLNESTISHVIQFGVDTEGDFHTFTDNTVSYIGMLDDIGIVGYGGQRGTAFHSEKGTDITFRYNNIMFVGYSGIHWFFCPNTTVEYNYIYGACLTLGDGAGIYCYASSDQGLEYSDNSIIQYNVIDSVIGSMDGYSHSNEQGCGIYLDDEIRYTDVNYNTVSDVNYYGLFAHNNQYCNFRNNTVFDAHAGYRYTHDFSAGNNNIKSNIFLNLSTTPTYQGADPVLALTNPFYANVAAVDSNAYYEFHRTNAFKRTDTYTFINFATWQSVMSNDANSTFDGTALGAGEKEILFYNASKTSKAQNLAGYTWRDLQGNTVTSLTLGPYESKILIQGL